MFHFIFIDLQAVKNTHTDKTFIYLRLERTYAEEHNFLILPSHPISNQQPDLFPYSMGFGKIDWNTMNLNQNQVSDKDYHKEVRMAECLSPITIPINDFQSIVVPNIECQNYIRQVMSEHNVNISFYIDVDEHHVYF